MISRFRAVLTDMDGTILGTREANFLAYKKAIQEFNLELTHEVFAATWGTDSRIFLRNLYPQLKEKGLEQIRQRKAEIYPDFLHLTTLNKPLMAIIQTLAARLPIGLVTTAKTENVNAILKHHALDQTFTTLVCGDDVSCSKPSPEPYLLAAARIGYRPEDLITFEDSEAGVESAHRAGVHVVKVCEFE